MPGRNTVMNMDHLITAADFLYSHSPAQHITESRNILLVSGETGDELADTFFELLFSTACRQDTTIRLIRLCDHGAKQKELDFICRNEKGIGAFARNEYNPAGGSRPLTICFYDYSDAAWRKEQDHFAWAVNLDSGETDIPCSPCHDAGEIRRLVPEKEKWSEEDEKTCEILRVARKVHTAYTAGWNSRYRADGITEELYGEKAEKGVFYCLRSSIRLAVSIPWKLAAAGVQPGEKCAEAFYRKLNEKDGKIREMLAWQEHRSWLAFMTLEGWKMPSVSEMKAYLYKNGNDYRDKNAGLHPCLCDLEEDDWNRPHRKDLRKLSVHQWSKAYAQQEDFCRMDRYSLIIHHLCKEIVLSAEYREKMQTVFSELEAALIQTGSWGIEEHLERVRLMKNLFMRLLNNEMNSYNPWRLACSSFEEGLEKETDPAFGTVRAAYGSVRLESRVAVERNRYCNYREIDAGIIRWLPWIVQTEEVGTIWKLYSKSSVLCNVLSSIIMRPRRLRILCAEKDAGTVPQAAFRRMLFQHGVPDIEISVTAVSDLREGRIPEEPDSVIDVTECGDLQNWLHLPENARVIFYGDDDLQDSGNSGFFAPVYHPYDFFMTVNEMMQLRGAEILSDSEENEMLGMEQDFDTLWNVSRSIKNRPGYPFAWRNTITALRKGEQELRKPVYRGEKEEIRPFSYRFDPERTEELTQSGALGVLHTLNSRGFITELQIDHGEGRITFGIFPEPEGKDRYRNTERYFTEMLDDRPETGFYTVVNEYLKHGEPCCFLNAREPIRIDFDRIAGEIIASEGLSEEKKPNIVKQICFGVDKLVGCGLLIPADGAADCYRYKTPAIRHELEKEGFALEAYVYYSLFLSGKFDDIRSNVRIKTGERAPGEALEKELDILVTKKGKMGLISCKDTENVSILHIGELRKQADMYGINAVPILVCTQALPEDIHTMCDYVRVGLITVVGPDLPVRITKILTGGGML